MTKKSLEEYSEVELKAELNRRAELERLEAEREQKAHEDFIKENIEFILKLVPEHSRTSCDDKNPQNDDRCNRCMLLRIKKDPWDMPEDMRVRLEMHWNHD